jgi:hypothetical protein
LSSLSRLLLFFFRSCSLSAFSIRQHTSAYASAYVSIRQHTSACLVSCSSSSAPAPSPHFTCFTSPRRRQVLGCNRRCNRCNRCNRRCTRRDSALYMCPRVAQASTTVHTERAYASTDVC